MINAHAIRTVMAQALWVRSKGQIYLPCHQLMVLTGTIIRNLDTIHIRTFFYILLAIISNHCLYSNHMFHKRNYSTQISDEDSLVGEEQNENNTETNNPFAVRHPPSRIPRLYDNPTRY